MAIVVYVNISMGLYVAEQPLMGLTDGGMEDEVFLLQLGPHVCYPVQLVVIKLTGSQASEGNSFIRA